MTRADLVAAIRDLADEEKLDLLEELWSSLDQDVAAPKWHDEELAQRLDDAAPEFRSWSDARSRILGAK